MGISTLVYNLTTTSTSTSHFDMYSAAPLYGQSISVLLFRTGPKFAFGHIICKTGSVTRNPGGFCALVSANNFRYAAILGGLWLCNPATV
jgi:hypothetical protein